MGLPKLEIIPTRPSTLARREERRLQKKKIRQKASQMRAELMSLGLKRHHLVKGVKVDITTKQRIALSYLVDFGKTYSPEYIAAQAGVSHQTLSNWRNDPVFIKALNRELDIRRTRMRLEAFRRLYKRLNQGSDKILLAYLKMTGDLGDNINLKTQAPHKVQSEGEVDKEIAALKAELGELDGRPRRSKS